MATAKIPAVKVLREAGTVRLRLCRTDRYNAIDTCTLHDLIDALQSARADGGVLVIEGEGGIFSVGPDITELVSLTKESAHAFSLLAHEVMDEIERWPGVTIAHLTGYALGSGLELALGCDVIVATQDLKLGLPGLAWAMVPCMGGLRRLSCRVPAEYSSDLFLKGEVLKAEAAWSIGLIDRILERHDDLDHLSEEMAQFSPEAVAAIRDLRLHRQGVIDKVAEASFFAQPFASGECQRRLRALLAS